MGVFMNKLKLGLSSQNKSLPLLPAVLATLLIIGLSCLTALGLGGIICICISGAVFAFLTVTEKNIIPWLSIPLSFGAALLISRDLLTAAAVLLYVPAGLILAYCVLTKKSLSVTVAALTAGVAVSMFIYLTAAVVHLYGGSIKESYISFRDQLTELLREVMGLLRYMGEDGQFYAYSDDIIEQLIHTFYMLLPGICAIACQGCAYGMAKLFRLFSKLFGFMFLYNNKPYKVTLSAGAAAIFLIAYTVSIFSYEESVIAYSSINLSYILMPASAIAGFHSIFSKDGFFRRKGPRTSKIILIVACGAVIFMSPLSVIPLLAMFGSGDAVGVAVSALLRARRNRNDDNQS